MSQSDPGEPELPEHDPNEPEPPDWAMLERVAAGQASAADRAAVERWIGLDPRRRRAELDLLRRVVDGTHALGATDFDAQASLARAETRLGFVGVSPRGADDETPQRVAPPRLWPRGVGGRDRPVLASLYGIAVAAVVVGLGSFAGSRLIRLAPSQPIRELTTTAGSRATVMLRDGTRLVLGPATHVRVPADFGRANRAVELDGEALFAVVHDGRHPFTVRAGRAVITDVGTEFDVRAYAGDAAVQVAVAEGQVSLSRGDRPHGRAGQALSSALVHGDVASVTDIGVTVRHGADVSRLMAWTQGRLIFEDTPLRDVAHDLARAFDLDVRVQDSTLARETVTATFAAESPDEVLAIVTHIVGAEYRRAGRTVLIQRRAGAAGIPHDVTPPPLTTARVG